MSFAIIHRYARGTKLYLAKDYNDCVEKTRKLLQPKIYKLTDEQLRHLTEQQDLPLSQLINYIETQGEFQPFDLFHQR